MEDMTKILMMLAKISPIDELIDSLEQDIKHYKSLPTSTTEEEKEMALSKIEFNCTVILAKKVGSEGNYIDPLRGISPESESDTKKN